jgi:ribosomal RNA assembly protein
MTRKISVSNIKKIKRAVPLIENKIKVKFSFGSDYVIIDANAENEFIVEQVVLAIDFGFEAEDALLLKNTDFLLKFIDIRDNTNRNNLKDVRGRIIGRNGKVKRAIENLTGSVVVIKDNDIGVIVDDLHLDATIQAIKTLIHGTKYGTVFNYLERQNRTLKHLDVDDLGLKDPKKDLEFENDNIL